jgi:glyoxylase-like metal-dependent hydrolase (beta-lactamase superfamily II)
MKYQATWSLIAVALLAFRADAGGTAWGLEIVPLKPDIYLLQRPEPLRQPVEGNVLVIVNERDVVVFEGGGMPVAADNAIRLIRSITRKPVSHLINSHWHGDHNLGNQVYRAQYPGITIVAHPATRDAMLGPPYQYVTEFDKNLGPTISEWTVLKQKGELSGPRTRLLDDLNLLIADSKRIQVTPADLTVADELVLHRGEREIHVRHLGKGNTEGDLIVWLPRERIVATGDLVVHPVPYGFGSFPREWIDTLARVEALDFELLVPGHGDVQRDRRYLELLRTMLAAMRVQAAAAVARGLDLEATRKALDFSAFTPQFPQDDMGKRLFEAWWTSPIGRSLWLEASGKPIVQAGSGEND